MSHITHRSGNVSYHVDNVTGAIQRACRCLLMSHVHVEIPENVVQKSETKVRKTCLVCK